MYNPRNDAETKIQPQQIVLNDGTECCVTCTEEVSKHQRIRCYVCQFRFHALCKKEPLCKKTLLDPFMKPTTSDNFQWFCNSCKSKDEIIKQADQNRRIEILEEKLDRLEGIEKKLETLVNLLNKSTATSGTTSNCDPLPCSPVPLYSDKTAAIRVKKPSDKSAQETLDMTVNVIQTNELQVVDTRVTSSGDTIVTLPNVEAAVKFKSRLQSDSPSSQTVDLEKKKVNISVVGVPGTTCDSLLNEILRKNPQIQSLIATHGTDHVITVNHIRPTRIKPAVNQANLTVSNTVRDLISKRNDRLLIGDMSCRVYSVTSNVKRCVKCQGLGHWHKECTAGKVTCANCAEQTHETRDCPNKDKQKCANCMKSGKTVTTPHRANSSICPAYLAERSKASRKPLN